MPTPSNETLAQIERAKKNLSKDQAPSLKQQTGSFVDWDSLSNTLGQPFDSNVIPLSKLHQMVRDPMIAFALLYIKVPLVRAPWHIKCERADIASFIDNALREIYGRIIFQYANSFSYGFQASVKRFELAQPDWLYIDRETGEERLAWENDTVEALKWKSFVALPPETVAPIWSENGDFNGIKYAPIGVNTTVSSMFGGTSQSDVDLEHALWVTNEKDSVFGSLYGYPRIGYAYRYWWSYWYNWSLADRHFEKDSDPPTVVRYPTKRALDDIGEEVDNRALALEIGQDLRSGSTIAMPSDFVEDLEGKSSGRYEWDVGHITTGGNFQAFTDRFQYLDIMKLRSVMVPEQAVMEGAGGSSSRNVAAEMGDIFYESQAVVMSDIDEHINKFIIPQLVQRNFPDFQGSCIKVTSGFSQNDTALSKQIIQLIGQSDPNKLQVDVREILEQAGVPLLSVKQIKAEEKKVVEDAQNQSPIDVPSDGKNAGVVGGKYMEARPVIKLSESNNLDANKSEWHHPEARDDRLHKKEVKAVGDNLFNVWNDTYANIYRDIANIINKKSGSINLAEDDSQKKNDFSALMIGVSATIKRYLDKADKKSNKPVGKLMESVAEDELKKINIEGVKWGEIRPDAAEWLSKYGAQRLQNVSETIKQEVRDWLSSNFNSGLSPKDLAQKFAEEFAEYPSWKAARVVRTEIRDAYNAATLLGGKAAGITDVIASDASAGKNLNTDQHCIDRNGKKYSIEDALIETDHPNGTLGWILVPSDVSVN